jgi:hypothetical protein
VKYADDFVLLAKEETVLQGIIDRLTEIRRCSGMDMNVDKTKVMRISSEPFPLQITIDQKLLQNVELFKYLGSVITNNVRCTCEIISRTATIKDTFNGRRRFFSSANGT